MTTEKQKAARSINWAQFIVKGAMGGISRQEYFLCRLPDTPSKQRTILLVREIRLRLNFLLEDLRALNTELKAFNANKKAEKGSNQ